MTASHITRDWRAAGTHGNCEHHEHGGCVAEEDVRLPLEFRPDGKWHIGTSVLDACPVEVVDEKAGANVLCGWDDECGQVITRAAAVDKPTGPDLAVMLLRDFAQRDKAWDYYTNPTLIRLRALLDLARALPDSLLTRQVRALFGDLDDTEAGDPAPVSLAQLWAVKAQTPGAAKPGQAEQPAPVTPPDMTPGAWIMAPDSSDPFGMRKIPRKVKRAYAEEQANTVGRWLIEFDGDYVYPTSLVTAEDHGYPVADPIPDRTALAVRYLAADGENISDQPAPNLGATVIHIAERSGEPLAMLELDPAFEFQRVWRLVPGFADVPAHWLAQRWTNADAAIFWAWDQIQALTS